MFRLYSFPSTLAGYARAVAHEAPSTKVFYETRRRLAEHAAHSHPVKARHGDKVIEQVNYLMISALSVDTSPGACRALRTTLCGIYERRPLGCRSVPIHYSRAEASAEDALRAFTATPGYGCDTSESAPPVIESGRVIDRDMQQARADASTLVERDRPWRKAILRRMKSDSPHASGLPSLRDVETNAAFGVTTLSMGTAWRIAAEAGIIGSDEHRHIASTQLTLFDQELATSLCPEGARKTLVEMRSEYRRHLGAD